jgi:D-serine deaminase-like pyridoxal phosphate-dependent protein
MLILVDHEFHLDILENFQKDNPLAPRWDIFIKIDIGSRRAGVPIDSVRLRDLISRAQKSSAVSIYGFYVHAGHVYGCKNPECAQAILQGEVDAVIKVGNLIESRAPIVLSFGSTPTAHVLSTLISTIPSHMELELHAGLLKCPP